MTVLHRRTTAPGSSGAVCPRRTAIGSGTVIGYSATARKLSW
jgi:hypothetical protein